MVFSPEGPGVHKINDPEAYIRVLLYTIDKAVANSFKRSDGTVGKVNIVLDCKGFGLSFIPKIQDVKSFLLISNEHYPDKFGICVIANLAGAARIFLNIILPFLPMHARAKIHILPNDLNERMHMLKSLVDEKFIPTWLGGTDSFRFRVDKVYK